MSISKTNIKDMTHGNPMKLMLVFSMPLMLGNLFQQLYTFVDALIIGRSVGAYALAALGVDEWLVFIMFGVIQGITQGCSVIIAQHFRVAYCVIAIQKVELCHLNKVNRLILESEKKTLKKRCLAKTQKIPHIIFPNYFLVNIL